MVEPAYASLTVEYLKVLMVEYLSSPYQSSPLKGPLLNSRACLRILISRAPCRVLALGSARPSGP